MQGGDTLRLRPTAVGVAGLFAFLLAYLQAENGRVAVGAFMALLLLALLDAALSMYAVTSRPVDLRPSVTIAGSPNRVAFAAAAPQGAATLMVAVMPMVQADGAVEETALPTDGSVVRVEHSDGAPHVVYAVRFRTSTSRFGLVVVNRWRSFRVPGGLWRGLEPAPDPSKVMPVVDEVARIREYQPGDRMSRIAWSVTARTGQLHVRSEGLDETEVHVRLDLGRPGTIADDDLRRTSQLAADVVGSFLELGVPVHLMTRVVSDGHVQRSADLMIERPQRSINQPIFVDGDDVVDGTRSIINAGVVHEVVTDVSQLHRRLAMTMPGPPLPRPAGPYIQIDPFGLRNRT